jgi:hypothetical protein
MNQQPVSIGNQRIAFTQSPGAGRPVIFVHGNSSSARTWDPVMTGRFGRRFRCLALDLPGHGESGPAPDPATYSLPGYAAVLAGFAAATGAAGAVIVGWTSAATSRWKPSRPCPRSPDTSSSAPRPSPPPARWRRRSCRTRR